MNKEQTIELAKQAGWTELGADLWGATHDGAMSTYALQRFAALVRADTALEAEPAPAQEPVVGALQIQLFGGEWIDCSQDTFNHYRKTGRSARALYTAPQPRKAVKLTSEEISQMWIDESFDAASHESCYMRGVRRGEAAFIAKNGLES